MQERGDPGCTGRSESCLVLFYNEGFEIARELHESSNQVWSSSTSRSCFLCLGGRFRLSVITRVTAGVIPEFRAARRASVALSNTFLRLFIPASRRDFTGFRN